VINLAGPMAPPTSSRLARWPDRAQNPNPVTTLTNLVLLFVAACGHKHRGRQSSPAGGKGAAGCSLVLGRSDHYRPACPLSRR